VVNAKNTQYSTLNFNIQVIINGPILNVVLCRQRLPTV
jgi:hypothetical protein